MAETDLISRAAAIGAIKQVFEWEVIMENDYVIKRRIFERLRQLPAVQPYTEDEIQKIQDLEQAQLNKMYQLGYEDGLAERSWIPCNEKLPKQGQKVICQCRANIITVLKLNANGDWYQDKDHCYMSGFVIAWMPLPEPWKGEQE